MRTGFWLLLFMVGGLALAQEPASISGTVFDLVTSAPLSNVEVRLIAGSMWEFKRVYGATTDQNGRFAITHVIPGDYFLEPELPGFLFPSPLKNGKRADIFTFKAGEHVADIHLQMARPSIISGRVVDEKAEPVVRQAVEALAVNSEFPSLQFCFNGQTDERGAYRLICRPGRYTIRTGSQYYPYVEVPEKAIVFNAKPGNEVSGIDFRIDRSDTAQPTTQSASDSALPLKTAKVLGKVVDANTGEPIRSARVILDGYTDTVIFLRPAHFKRYETRTDPRGEFKIVGIASGTYAISAAHDGFLFAPERLPNAVHPLKLNDADVQQVTLELIAQAVISGRVITGDGAPVYRIAVSAHPRSYRTETSAPTGALTDERGAFRIYGLRQGEYEVKATPEYYGRPAEIRTDGRRSINYGETYYPSTLGESEAGTVHVNAGGESSIVITLKEAPILHISGHTPPPSGFTRITIQCQTRNGRAAVGQGIRASTDGQFVMWRVPPGQYRLIAQYDGPGRTAQSPPVNVDVVDSLDNVEIPNGLERRSK